MSYMRFINSKKKRAIKTLTENLRLKRRNNHTQKKSSEILDLRTKKILLNRKEKIICCWKTCKINYNENITREEKITLKNNKTKLIKTKAMKFIFFTFVDISIVTSACCDVEGYCTSITDFRFLATCAQNTLRKTPIGWNFNTSKRDCWNKVIWLCACAKNVFSWKSKS